MNTNAQQRQRQQLAEWLAERELDRVLMDPVDEPGAAPEVRYDLKPGKIEPGEIYILRPAAKNSHLWGPVYVLVLESVTGSRWRVIPFGRYAVPAVPGEWATGLTAPPLRVLCFWNVREISAGFVLPGSVKKLTPRLMREIHIIYRHVLFGETAGDSITKRLGPSIQHPADPRYDYLDDERLRLDEHQNEAAGRIIQFDDSETKTVAWRLAAEGRPRYGKSRDE